MTAAGNGSGDGGGRFADDARRYRLTDRIATGGMGEVWRAEDSVLHRTVAVKVLKDEYADDATFRTRFEGEARHAGALHHPGIASVFDFGQEHSTGQPRPYLVMEHVDGRPLSALLRPGAPMDPRVVQDLIGQAADALAAAHAKGIVHRDVKPANLLVTPDRRVKITDFGIARAAEGMALTETGQVLGTPHYLSPEQARGDRATSSSDLYSLGVVAFECLAGRRPFTGDSPVTTALAHLRDPVPELPPSVPADLAAVVRRALAKEPEERFGSAAELAAAVRDPAGAVAAGAAGSADPPTAPVTADDDGTPATAVLPPAAGAAGAAAGAAGAAAAMARTSDTDARREDDSPAGAPAAAGDGRTRSGSPAWLPVLLGLAVLLLVVLLLWLLLREDPEESAAPAAPTSSAPATSQEPTGEATSAEPQPTEEAPPTEEEPETFDLDESAYLGRDVKDVEKELRDLGLAVEKVELDNDGSQPEGTVDDVSPTEGLAEGDTVTVSYWGKAAEDPPGEGGPGPGNGNGNGGNGGNGGGDD